MLVLVAEAARLVHRLSDWGSVYCKYLEMNNIDWDIVFSTGVLTDVVTGVVFIVNIWK